MSNDSRSETPAPAVGAQVQRGVSPAEPERDIARDAARLQFLEDQADSGYCPNVVFDDDGNWAVSYEGSQPMPRGDGAGFAETVGITCVVEPHQWRPSLRAAIDAAMDQAARSDEQG